MYDLFINFFNDSTLMWYKNKVRQNPEKILKGKKFENFLEKVYYKKNVIYIGELNNGHSWKMSLQ